MLPRDGGGRGKAGAGVEGGTGVEGSGGRTYGSPSLPWLCLPCGLCGPRRPARMLAFHQDRRRKPPQALGSTAPPLHLHLRQAPAAPRHTLPRIRPPYPPLPPVTFLPVDVRVRRYPIEMVLDVTGPMAEHLSRGKPEINMKGFWTWGEGGEKKVKALVSRSPTWKKESLTDLAS